LKTVALLISDTSWGWLQNLKSLDVTMPLSGQLFIHRLRLVMINLYATIKVSLSISYKDIKAKTKSKKRGGFG